jgi:hypothetical protein
LSQVVSSEFCLKFVSFLQRRPMTAHVGAAENSPTVSISARILSRDSDWNTAQRTAPIAETPSHTECLVTGRESIFRGAVRVKKDRRPSFADATGGAASGGSLLAPTSVVAVVFVQPRLMMLRTARAPWGPCRTASTRAELPETLRNDLPPKRSQPGNALAWPRNSPCTRGV